MRYTTGRQPRFFPGPSRGKVDATTKSGAELIASRIVAAWLDAGERVKVWVEMQEPAPGAFPRPVIRSNLKNGMPRR